ncbi:MAG: TPM domain-containing protein [Acidobacteriota bacterium]
MKPGRRPGWRSHASFALVAALALGLALPILAAFTAPPSPTRWVTDTAGFLSDGARSDLDSRLEQYERESGHQFLVWIAPTSGELSPEDFADQAFQAWRVGRKGMDDGLVLFVFANDKKLRFEVGYGLEAALPDALAGQILSQAIVPRLRAGDNDGGIRAGVEAAIAAITTGVAGGSPTSASPAPASPDAGTPGDSSPQLTTGQKILFGLLAIGFLILLITHPGFAIWLLFNILSGGGGRGGGGGGFSGGGGRSGGGGASGSW